MKNKHETQKISDAILDILVYYNVTDVFGIPGGSILEFLYAADRNCYVKPHLLYHEQDAVFAASGYAQTSNLLGVAYATKGPGFTNMLTGISDAFYDSIPIIVFTAHEHSEQNLNMRAEYDQEMDTVSIVQKITKYAIRIDDVHDVIYQVSKACKIALTDRKGPVFIDISSKLLNQEVQNPFFEVGKNENEDMEMSLEQKEKIIDLVYSSIEKAIRPIFLIGDGIRQANAEKEFLALLETIKLPVLSSRGSQHIAATSDLYYGYVGSHGIRYSNFILEKCDLIIVIGNRMAFPTESLSYKSVFENTKVIRIEIDKAELERQVPNVTNIQCDLKNVLKILKNFDWSKFDFSGWIEVCNTLYNKLSEYDIGEPEKKLEYVIKHIKNTVGVVDVGNHEFWFSRAYEYYGSTDRIIYSRSFGTLGCALGKAIGAHYATHKDVLAIVGDQGLQVNIQELQFISSNKLPIMIIVLNNHSSGMIKSRQKKRYNGNYLHTTEDSGYSVPKLDILSLAFDMNYYDVKNTEILTEIKLPALCEIFINEDCDLDINIPYGNRCCDMVPMLPSDLFNELNLL